MNPEDFNYFQSRVSRFISGSRSGRSFLSGAPVARVTRISGIFPKRRIPQEILSKPSTASDDGIESSKSSISSLGRVTLDLEIINNNLDRIAQIILGDYKSTQETNKKEIEEYRKRVANRGRIFGKKELGDKKTDLLGGIKKFIGSFFSGTGGSIRALAMFNLLQGLMSGDPSKIIGPLLGIGMTYIPAIVSNIVSGVAGGLATKLFSGGGSAQAAGAAAPMATKAPKFAKFGRNAALAGLFATMAASIIKPDEDPQRKRLEDLTAEQKTSVSPDGLQPITQDDLKRFDNLNKKFEAALDFLLGKKGTQQDEQRPSRGGGGGQIRPVDTTGTFSGSTAAQQAFTYFKSKGLTDEDSAAIVGNLLQENRAMDPTLANSIGMKGIAQWDASRWAGLEAFAASKGLDPNKRETQLQYVYYEFATGSGGLGLERLKGTPGLEAKTKLVRTDYERPGEAEAMDAQRIQYAKDVMRMYAGVVPTGSPSVPSPVVAAALREQRPAATTPATRQQPKVIMIPAETGTGDQQSSAAVGVNDIVPTIDTTYPENFLALYSKLIYQIV